MEGARVHRELRHRERSFTTSRQAALGPDEVVDDQREAQSDDGEIVAAQPQGRYAQDDAENHGKAHPDGDAPERGNRVIKGRRRRQDAGEPRRGVRAYCVERGEAEVEQSSETHHHVESQGQQDPDPDLLDDEVHPELLMHELGQHQRHHDDHGNQHPPVRSSLHHPGGRGERGLQAPADRQRVTLIVRREQPGDDAEGQEEEPTLGSEKTEVGNTLEERTVKSGVGRHAKTTGRSGHQRHEGRHQQDGQQALE